MSRSTEKSYLYYILDYIYFHNKRHPQEMGVDEIRGYLSHLAMHKNIAVSTQILKILLYRHYCFCIGKFSKAICLNIERARQPKRLPVVLTRNEVQKILAGFSFQPTINLLQGIY